MLHCMKFQFQETILSDPIWALKLNKVISIKTRETNLSKYSAVNERIVKLFVMLYMCVLNGGTKLSMQTRSKIEIILNKSNSTGMGDKVTVFLFVCNFFFMLLILLIDISPCNHVSFKQNVEITVKIFI